MGKERQQKKCVTWPHSETNLSFCCWTPLTVSQEFSVDMNFTDCPAVTLLIEISIVMVSLDLIRSPNICLIIRTIWATYGLSHRPVLVIYSSYISLSYVSRNSSDSRCMLELKKYKSFLKWQIWTHSTAMFGEFSTYCKRLKWPLWH